jgi:Skp family chaperone for outer membrane proteins
LTSNGQARWNARSVAATGIVEGVETVIGAVIAAVAALGGVGLAQYLQRSSDQARWSHEAEDRRRQHGEQAAREVRRELLAAAAMLSREAGAERSGKINGWEDVPDEHIGPHTDRARDLVFDVPDKAVKEFVKLAANALENSDIVVEWGGPSPWDLGNEVEADVDAVIGAYVDGNPIPAAPKTKAASDQIDWHWKQVDEQNEKDRQDWLARRKARREQERAAKAEEAAETDAEEAAPTLLD